MALLKRTNGKSIEVENDYAFKAIVVGDSNTGKTSLIRRYVYKKFVEGRATVSVSIRLRTTQVS